MDYTILKKIWVFTKKRGDESHNSSQISYSSLTSINLWVKCITTRSFRQDRKLKRANLISAFFHFISSLNSRARYRKPTKQVETWTWTQDLECMDRNLGSINLGHRNDEKVTVKINALLSLCGLDCYWRKISRSKETQALFKQDQDQDQARIEEINQEINYKRREILRHL